MSFDCRLGDRSRRNRGRVGGFSLIEAVIAFGITLVVLALVFSLIRSVQRIYARETRSAEITSGVVRALDDIVFEISRAGYGLGDRVSPIRAIDAEGNASDGLIAIWSNPDGTAGKLDGRLEPGSGGVRLAGATDFREGDRVLLLDLVGAYERAEVIDRRVVVEGDILGFRSLDGESGELQQAFDPDFGARVLGLAEVGYRLGPEMPGRGRALIKNSSARPDRPLTHWIDGLRFDYATPEGNELSPARLEQGHLGLVKVTLRYSVGDGPGDRRTLTTSVGLDRQKARIRFSEPGYGFRLSRFFYPIQNPSGVAMRRFYDWGVIVAGHRVYQEPCLLYTFLAARRVNEARSESSTYLYDVRGPSAVAFGPERDRFAGSLFVVTPGLLDGRLNRVHPDGYGVLSTESEVETFDPEEELAATVGIAFGPDDALYSASRQRGAVYRFAFDGSGRPLPPEEVARVRGAIEGIAAGADGSLYFIENQARDARLWTIAFSSALRPEPAELVGLTPGKGLGLASDPVSSSLFALIEDWNADTAVYELPPWWLALRDSDPALPPPVFRLSEFREETLEGPQGKPFHSDGTSPVVENDEGGEQKGPFPMAISRKLPQELLPEELDDIDFDSLGLMYLFARDLDLVLQFDLDRREDERNAVDLSATIETSPDGQRSEVRLHAWKARQVGK